MGFKQGTNNATSYIQADGNASFASTFSTNFILETERDDPANYTTTMVDGEETQVYNGPTLDVKERLQKAHETFQELQVAVENATDFAGLKAAMMVALEDYAA